MALFTPSQSPGIVVKETDLTGVVQNVPSSVGAIVGNFRWGNVEVATKIDQESKLASTFGAPNTLTTIDFHSAAQFLRYSSELYVTRAIDAGTKNAYSATEGDAVPTIKNQIDFDNQKTALDTANHTFVAKWPGDLGNSLKVSLCPFDSDGSSFNSWAYKSSFDQAPTTSSYAATKNASNDELHVVVIDEDGKFSGTPGTVLETFPFLSLATNAKNDDGSTNYAADVVNTKSEYVWFAGWGAASGYDSAGAGTTADSGDNFVLPFPNTSEISLSAGVASAALTPTEIAVGFDTFEDPDTITVDFLIATDINATADNTTVVNDLVATAQSLRKDCVAVTSPARSDVINTTNPVTDTIAGTDTYTNSSYLVVDNNFLKIYDKYNDNYIHVPAASSTAGIMAATDYNAAPWYSPAGSRRGQYLGITSLAYSPTKSERDTLYKAGVNPIANIPGQGVLLYGDKTKLARPSAFDRINVRRLFVTVERAVALAARNVMFEFNDEFTRAEFVNIVEPFLREIKGRRGITDFKVVCDETNNTGAVIDRNEFIATIFIKPARSINFVTLNFVATRTGVEFSEVVGTV